MSHHPRNLGFFLENGRWDIGRGTGERAVVHMGSTLCDSLDQPYEPLGSIPYHSLKWSRNNWGEWNTLNQIATSRPSGSSRVRRNSHLPPHRVPTLGPNLGVKNFGGPCTKEAKNPKFWGHKLRAKTNFRGPSLHINRREVKRRGGGLSLKLRVNFYLVDGDDPFVGDMADQAQVGSSAEGKACSAKLK